MKEVIIITGATNGIGFELAQKFLNADEHVVVIGRNQDILDTYKVKFPKAIALQADFTDSHQITQTVNEIKDICDKQNFKIKYLVNNAAKITPLGRLDTQSMEDFDKIMRLNVKAPLFLTTGLSPLMHEQSRVLNISTRAAQNTYYGVGLYCATKHALLALTHTLQKEYKNQFAVSHLIPGEVNTNMQKDLRAPSEADFPMVSFFHENEKNLIPAPLSATFMHWVLTATTSEEFVRDKEWYVYDKSLHSRWVPEGHIFNYPEP